MMGWFDKYCEKCGMIVDKNTAPQRFGKYFCSEEHAREYAKEMEEKRSHAPHQGSHGGCC
jgi:YHS domain-containing protein